MQNKEFHGHVYTTLASYVANNTINNRIHFILALVFQKIQFDIRVDPIGPHLNLHYLYLKKKKIHI